MEALKSEDLLLTTPALVSRALLPSIITEHTRYIS